MIRTRVTVLHRHVNILALILLLVASTSAPAQVYKVTGIIKDEYGMAVTHALVRLPGRDTTGRLTGVDTAGRFTFNAVAPGSYRLRVTAEGYTTIERSLIVSKSDADAGMITLQPAMHMLEEVSVVERALAMVQKDDTLEYSSGAYKVNPDADAADLARKMPGIQVTGQQITAQGESVLKVLVDGKPFFGSDPYAALKNLPADVVSKIQVYNEKSDQERFTGFSEGKTVKTINIITRPDKRKGIFGNIYGGYGGSDDHGGMYGTGTTLNFFDNERKVTFTGQLNNVNSQNFSTDAPGAAAGGGPITTTRAAGINYTDKWGKRTEVSGSYFFNSTTNDLERIVQKTYLLSTDSGQVYDEQGSTGNTSASHRMSLRIDHTIDSMNSLLLTPAISVSTQEGRTTSMGATRLGTSGVNSITDNSDNNSTGIAFSGSLLFRHKFHRRGRTLSVNVNASDNGSNGTSTHNAESIYYLSPQLSDSLRQRSLSDQAALNVTGNITYTEPISAKTTAKAEYNMSYMPSYSERNTYDFSDATGSYSVLNPQYSNTFYSNNTTHKAGVSYQVRLKRGEVSVGLAYQINQLRNEQQQPYEYKLKQDFSNLLPTISFRLNLSKTRNLAMQYSTGTQVPSVIQLQDVVNNTDPLHLFTGNPGLKQPYQHNLMLRYNATAKAKRSFGVTLTANHIENYITSSSFIAASDSLIRNGITLPKGSQLTVPVNTAGYTSVLGNITFGLPIDAIKCHLNLNVNSSITLQPSVINGETNYQYNKNGGAGVTISSNISERVDFMLSSNATLSASENTVNRNLSTTYMYSSTMASLNLILWKGMVVSTSAQYRSNGGLAAAYNHDYLVWNMSIGKKFFKRQQGDLRLTAFDLLNNNSNIQHSVTDIYIQDSRNNVLQRYFLLVFTYKIREFK